MTPHCGIFHIQFERYTIEDMLVVYLHKIKRCLGNSNSSSHGSSAFTVEWNMDNFHVITT